MMPKLSVMCFLALATAPFAHAQGSFGVRLDVPDQCSLDSEPLQVSESRTAYSGLVFESCNSAAAYDVLAAHRALEAGESVLVRYDGLERILSAGGQTVLSSRAGAVHGAQAFEISAAGLQQDLVITLTLASR